MKKIIALVLTLVISLSLFASDTTFALVLSGGGARGIAEIAVLKELDRRGLYPDYIVGTSIGSLVGAFYAAGYSGEELEALILEGDLSSLFTEIYARSGGSELDGGTESPLRNVLNINFSDQGIGAANGLINDRKIASFFRKNLAKVLSIHDFDNLSVVFRCVGTDLKTGDEIIFSRGSIYDAMRSSMSIPVVFSPVKNNHGQYVVDGGIVNNMPADIARSLGADIVLSVDLGDVLDLHPESRDANNLDTLSGVIYQTLDLVTHPNVVDKYPLSDYVIVPELNDIGTLDFGKAEEILKIGEDAVKDSAVFFDQLEERLGSSVRTRPTPYSEREYINIEGIYYANLERYSEQFEHFVGKILDEDTVDELENLLTYIQLEEDLKSIDFEVYNGVVVIESEEYTSLSSAFSLGFNVNTGVNFDYLNLSNPSVFYFYPHFSAFFTIGLPENSGQAIFGLEIKNYSSLFATYSYDFPSRFSLFASARIGVGNLSMLSIADWVERMDTSDFVFSLEGGFAYDYMDSFRLEASIDFDITMLGNIKSIQGGNERERMAFYDPSFNLNLKYNTLSKRIFEDNGVNLSFDAAIYMRPPMMYNLRTELESRIPSPWNNFKFYINAEALALRGNEFLEVSYTTNKTGDITRDYLMLEAGGRVRLPASFFLEAGIYAEGYETRSYPTRQWERVDDFNLIPFSLINDWSLGFSLYGGYSTAMGDIMIGVDISIFGKISIGVKFV